MQKLDGLSKANAQQQMMVQTLSNSEQSFYPAQTIASVAKPPGLDIQSLKDSVGAINNQIKNIEGPSSTNILQEDEEKQTESRSQNRLEKHKRSMFGQLPS